MPRDNRAPPVKLYYRIGEVAELVGVEPHVLRYWESEFPTIRPQKSRSGQRVYSRRDVDKLLRVKDLLYAQRFTIAGARQRLRGSSVGSMESGSEPSQGRAIVAPMPATSTTAELTSMAADSESSVRATAAALRSTLIAARSELLEVIAALAPARVEEPGDTEPRNTEL